MAGHVGLLQREHHIHVVYRSGRDGCTWNSAIIRKSWRYFCAQAVRLGLIANFGDLPGAFASILLVDGVGQKVSAFQWVVEDPCRLRRDRDRSMGRETSALYAFPIVREARPLVALFARGYSTLGWMMSLCESYGSFFSVLSPVRIIRCSTREGHAILRWR